MSQEFLPDDNLDVSAARPLYLKRVSQSIATSLIRSYRQSGDRTDNQAIVPIISRSYRQSVDRTDNQAIEPTSKANLKKQGKFSTNGSVTAESVLQGHQKSVKLARPLD